MIMRPANLLCDLRSRRGGVALMFAASALPLTFLVGLVVNFATILQAKSELDVVADSAAIAGAQESAKIYAAGYTSAAQIFGQSAAIQLWNAQTGRLSGAITGGVSPTINIVQTGQNFAATVSYTAHVLPVMPNLMNWASGYATISNTVSANITVNVFATVDFLLDNSSSMMLPATTTDTTNLQNAIYNWVNVSANATNVINNAQGNIAVLSSGYTYPGPGGTYNSSTVTASQMCAFACHWNASSTASNPQDFYGVARSAGVTLRWDSLVSATTYVLKNTMQFYNASSNPNGLEKQYGQFSVGIFSFGGSTMGTSAYLQTVFAEAPIDQTVNGVATLGAGATKAITALSGITPPVSQDVSNTSFGDAFTLLYQTVGNGGNGYTAQSPLKSVILITDGVEDDTPGGQSIPTTEGPINPAVCSTMKANGYTVLILDIQYQTSLGYLTYWNQALAAYVNGTATPSLPANLQACATSAEDVITVDPNSPSDIQAGLVALLDQAVGSTVRLSN
jgi:Flp pilus assembly protein TadG